MDFNSVHKDASLGSLEKQLICPICLEVFTKPVVILPCQHNLCRKCANELYQPSLFQVGIGGRFRCPSCRHEVVLDRHGVYGLQRNLLVENIIDAYKKASASLKPPPLKPQSQITCEEHEGEKLNVYCITCQIPTCSLCKVFGAHNSCQVAPLTEVCQQQKVELTDEIGSLIAKNEHIQAYINDLEEICRTIEENSRNQKQILCEKFDRMCGILEERRKIMSQRITCEQDEKTSQVQNLVHTYSEHVDSNVKLVQTALNTMEEPEMAAFVQTSGDIIEKVSNATTCTLTETLQPGYANMDHYKVDFNAEERALCQLDFIKTEEEVSAETSLEPEPEPQSEPDPGPEPETEPEHDETYSLLGSHVPDHELKSANCEIKNAFSETREDTRAQTESIVLQSPVYVPADIQTRAQSEACAVTKKEVLCEKGGLNTQQAIIHILYVLAFLVILQKVLGSIHCFFCI
ncbi:tripartite motif containing 101 [Trichomycterus rosablanca]|uniref:tripartite motif containing 101 n=1 Tax=Trichomycterus rosablanca TaxID=2290929 RepID=UPI002F3578F9